MIQQLRLFEMFSGYGTASFALKMLGINSKCIGYSDIDKYANQCFRQNHEGEELGDVKNINPNNLEDFDLLTGGFPCQAFSTAGKMNGELDPRGTLFNEIIRIAKVKQPKYMLLENVKGLTTKRFKSTFDKILSELDKIGYDVKWEILNTKDFGIPQNRERVWFVCFRKDLNKKDFKFPEPIELNVFLKDILEDEVEKKYYLSEKQINKLKEYVGKKNKINSDIINCIGTCFGRSGSSKEELESFARVNKALMIGNLSRYKMKSERSMPFKQEGVSWALTGNCDIGVLDKYSNLRKLTPKECFRLQGFLNDEVNLEGLSNTQKYKLAGNGQSVNVVSKIFQEMFK